MLSLLLIHDIIFGLIELGSNITIRDITVAKQNILTEFRLPQPVETEMFGVTDNLKKALLSGDKILQEQIENGIMPRFSPNLYNNNRKKTKQEEANIKIAWRNADNAEKLWKEYLKKKRIEKYFLK